ncbi:MAG: hypothetical protein PHG65_10255 [Kiritimatiellae bacterium]|nr:hypothetical protein [Kiritimatiellia bacterium]
MTTPLLRLAIRDPQNKRARARWKDLVRVTLGWLFILLGILGLFLPILQGILFLAIGLWLLAPHVPLFHRLQQRVYARHPRIKKRIRRIRAKIKMIGSHRPAKNTHQQDP